MGYQLADVQVEMDKEVEQEGVSGEITVFDTGYNRTTQQTPFSLFYMKFQMKLCRDNARRMHASNAAKQGECQYQNALFGMGDQVANVLFNN